MANNFKNAVRRNISADSTLPTTIYSTPDSKKSIAIEIDVSNKSSAGVTVTVQLEDESLNETYDTAGTVIAANAHAVSAATGVSGLFTTTSSAVHNLIVNDRVLFNVTAAPSFTNASLPPSAEAALSVLRFYYVQSIPSTTTFTIAETRSAASPQSFYSAGTAVEFKKIHLADLVKDAPVPVGGALKVIAGQKIVMESAVAGANDKLYAYTSGANSVDVIASVLQDVS